MHGVKRAAAQSASARAARKEKEAAKLQNYLKVEATFFQVREADQLDEVALNATTALLALNPEYYTAWNYRRRILTHLFLATPHRPSPQTQVNKNDFFAAARSSEASRGIDPNQSTSTSSSSSSARGSSSSYKLQEKLRLLEEDLELTTHALKAHPKVYWIWNHRKWCLIEMPEDEDEDEDDDACQNVEQREREERRIQGLEAKWKREMRLVDKMLELDPRNFHGWDYRRYLISQISLCSIPASSSSPTPIPPFPSSLSSSTLPSSIRKHHLHLAKSELSYTMKKIEANFSNFSAWHWRSKLLPHVWSSMDRSMQGVEEKDVGVGVGEEEEEREVQEERLEKWREEELDLVRQAIYTDPDDQSVWLYHTWLVDLDLFPSPSPSCEGPSSPDPHQARTKRRKKREEKRRETLLKREIQSISELLLVEPDCRYALEASLRYRARLVEVLVSFLGDGDSQEGGGKEEEEEEEEERRRKRREEVDRMSQEERALVQRLIEVDPDRKGRYADLSQGRGERGRGSRALYKQSSTSSL